MDFTSEVSDVYGGIAIKKPSVHDVNIGNFIFEFRLGSWIVVLASFFIWWIAILTFLLLSNNLNKKDVKTEPTSRLVAKSLNAILRAIINKVHNFKLNSMLSSNHLDKPGHSIAS